MRKASEERHRPHGTDPVRGNCQKPSYHPRPSHQIGQKKADQNQSADRNEIELDSCGQKPCRSPADHESDVLHPRPAQAKIQAAQNQPLGAQRHIHRHLRKHDGRNDKEQASYSRLRLFSHIVKNQKGSERSLQSKAQKPPQSEILKLIRQNSPEQLKEYRHQRNRIRKYHRHLIGPGHPVHQTDGKGPVAVPKEAPAQIMLSQISSSKQPVRVGKIQHMHAVNAQKSDNSDRHSQQPDHIFCKPGQNALSVQLPHSLCFSFHPDVCRPWRRQPCHKLEN